MVVSLQTLVESSKEVEDVSDKKKISELILQAKAVFFDYDDTLVKTIQAKWAQHKYIASKFYGKKLSDKELKLHWGKPLTVLLKLLYGTDHIDIATSYNLALQSRFPKKLFDDTLSTLKILKSVGKKIGIVTSTSLASIENDFAELKIPKRSIDYLQTEDDTAFHKPDSRVFDPSIQWLSEQGITPAEAVYVGDLPTDCEAAEGVGFQFIGIATGIVSMAEFAKREILAASRLSDLCLGLSYTASA